MQLTIQEVPLDKIWWENRYREDFGDMEGLVDSIKDKGIIQAITVTPKFELLSGGRRVTAARTAGLTTIPALIREKRDAIDAREVELIENLVRKDWNWTERVRLTAEIDRLYKETKTDWSGRATAKLLDRSQSSVARDLQLAESLKLLPELGELDTADEALKLTKKIETQAIVGELRRRQVEQVGSGIGLDKGLQTMLKLADANYRIGDTFAGMAEFPDGGEHSFTRFHIIECDPPYGINLTEQKASKDSVTSNVHTYKEVETKDYPAFLTRLANELFRIAGGNTWLIFWYGPTWHHMVKDALITAGWKVDDIPCVWTKKQGQTLQPKMYFARGYEPFFLARKGSPVIMKEGRLNVFDFPSTPSSQKYHPTERPVPMLEEILTCLGVPMQSVFVPFLGSGATLRAAYNCGMKAIGFDLNGEYKDKFMLAVEADTRAIGNEPEVGEEEVFEDDEFQTCAECDTPDSCAEKGNCPLEG